MSRKYNLKKPNKFKPLEDRVRVDIENNPSCPLNNKVGLVTSVHSLPSISEYYYAVLINGKTHHIFEESLRFANKVVTSPTK